MQLVIQQVQVGQTVARTIDNVVRSYCEVLFLGGKFNVENPNKIAPGVYSSVAIDVQVRSEAKSWRSKDNRSGAMIAQEISFGGIAEATPLKK